jgi:hypothetical protein
MIEYGDQLVAVQLDVGRDDYYGHPGDWWDVRDSLFLDRLDGADRTPPAPLEGLTATSDARGVHLSWSPSADDAGPVQYEVYRDGEPRATQPATRYDDADAVDGETHVYRVRPVDAAGRLGAEAALRFTAGLGIVDDAGSLVRDTVRPPDVGGLAARRSRRMLVLSWRAAPDRGGLRGYRVLRNGKLFRTIPARVLAVPLRLARATWSVRAVDVAGNLGGADRLVVRRA